jgi:hypothetical protein
MVGGFLRRLVLLVVALGVATALLVGAMSMLTPAAPAKASPVLQRDHAGAMRRAVARQADQPASKGSPPLPGAALVLGGLVLLAALPSAQRVHVYDHRYYHRVPGSYWQ